MPELEVAVRYVPASDRAEIGGDFYEVERFGDAVMVAVGDVGGHSLHAATIMAELRHATRAYLAEGHRPAAVMDRLNHLMQDDRDHPRGSVPVEVDVAARDQEGGPLVIHR